MAKTEVILTQHVSGLGAESDHIKVAAGYARNYLIPEGLAIPLTASNKRRLEVLRQRRAEREAHEYNTMSELAKAVSKLTTIIKVKTGDDGKLFGSVTAGMIAEQLKNEFDISLDRRKIHLEQPLRTLGEHEIELHLHTDVNASLKVVVESSTPLPAKSAPASSGAEAEQAPAEGEERRSGRGGRGPRKPRSA